jgi:hypothetical protein
MPDLAKTNMLLEQVVKNTAPGPRGPLFDRPAVVKR